ncbi:aromatic-ring hydroxylase C-terminal domain-containing protein [Kibdelosporangium banguiense]|uniref:aromatic-ring hydroxylase C-terminal domain-containing protein n=1 Tax=Kibdelosporangium banguiense TaxID=1365924 RepID=UPI00355720DF
MTTNGAGSHNSGSHTSSTISWIDSPGAEPWTNRVRHVTATADSAPAPALLIRPDGYIAWAGKDPDTLKAALTRWFTPN